MKIELETKYLTSDQQKAIFDMAVDAKVREKMSQIKGVTGQRKTKKTRKSSKRFTETEIATIWKEYRNGNTPERIATLVGRRTKSVNMVIYRMTNRYKLSSVMQKVLAY